MRRFLFATLLASPALFTAAAFAGTPADNASAPAQVRPVSTGVSEPRLVSTTRVSLTPEAAYNIPNDAKVVLQVQLDEKGIARSVQVVKSVSPELDARVIEAVRQFRWQPAMLDKQAIAVGMTLNVLVQH